MNLDYGCVGFIIVFLHLFCKFNFFQNKNLEEKYSLFNLRSKADPWTLLLGPKLKEYLPLASSQGPIVLPVKSSVPGVA